MPDPEMTSDQPPPRRRTPFEWSLAALRPAESDAERPSFMFKAGQASRDGAVRFWRWVAVGCVVALAGTLAGGGFLLADARERAEMAEARAAGSPRPTPASRDREGAGVKGEDLPPPAPPPWEGRGEREDHSLPPPSPPREGGPGGVGRKNPSPPKGSEPRGDGSSSSPTPQEIAAALRTRRDILVAGLGLIPDGKPGPFTPEKAAPAGWPTPGVLTAPKIAPKPPAKPEPDDPPPTDIIR